LSWFLERSRVEEQTGDEAMNRVRTGAAALVWACVLLVICACRAGAQAVEDNASAAPAAPGGVPTITEGTASPSESLAVRGIWFWPHEGEGGAAQTMRQMERAGINTIFLLVFSGGHTVYPSRVFPQQDELRGQDPVAAFVGEAHARGMRVFAAMDTLYWQRPGSNSPAVGAHPERMERNAEGEIVDDDGRPGGAFASPSNPDVASLLQQLVSELAAKYPFDGIAFDYARLARGDYLGYSTATRAAYISAKGMDPADIDPLGYATELEQRRSFAAWLENQVSSLVEKLGASFRRVRQEGQVAAVILPDYYQNRLLNAARQDWLTWAQKGWVDAFIVADASVDDLQQAVSQRAALARGHRARLLAAITGHPASDRAAAAYGAGFAGTVLWPGDSLSTRRALLREFGG